MVTLDDKIRRLTFRGDIFKGRRMASHLHLALSTGTTPPDLQELTTGNCKKHSKKTGDSSDNLSDNGIFQLAEKYPSHISHGS